MKALTHNRPLSLHIAIALLIFLPIAGEAWAEPKLTLSGRYEYRTDAESLEMLGSLVCFYPSPNSAKSLPRPGSDKRLAWFCFKNEAESKKILGIPTHQNKSNCGYSGEATVHLTAYTTYLGEGDGFDTALLQSVGNSTKPRILPCQ